MIKVRKPQNVKKMRLGYIFLLIVQSLIGFISILIHIPSMTPLSSKPKEGSQIDALLSTN